MRKAVVVDSDIRTVLDVDRLSCVYIPSAVREGAILHRDITGIDDPETPIACSVVIRIPITHKTIDATDRAGGGEGGGFGGERNEKEARRCKEGGEESENNLSERICGGHDEMMK
jgi:hypothetical protein